MIKESLFGFPIVKQKIEKNKYDKDKIIKDILYNYNLNPSRNKWDALDSSSSNLHLSYGDDENKFKKIDYSTLIPIYTEKIKNFLKNIYFKTPIKFNYTIVNYTCVKSSQYMREHVHPESDFTAVHYLKFDKNEHHSTCFTNTHKHSKFSNNLLPALTKKLDMTKTENSWICEYYNINTDEDDFVITPSIVEHAIPFHNNCKNHRITVVTNINIENN